MDSEMITFFVDEIKEIKQSMVNSISSLIETKLEDSSKFEEAGQMVDRIYGTAATLGYNELSGYTKALKEVSYMASLSQSEEGRAKALKFLIRYVELSDKICASFLSQDELKSVTHELNHATSEAALLSQNEFHNIDQKSCSIEE